MKKIILSILCLFIFSCDNDDDLQIIISNYIKHFNNKDIKALNDIWDSPIVFFIGNKTVKVDNYGDLVNFEALENEGCAYSTLNTVEEIFKQKEIAIYKINFSRFNNKNEEILSTDANLTLIKKNGSWKLKIGIIPIDLSIGK